MTLPNFLVIGAPKCGTTSLYQYLKAHPQIYMSPVKEPRYFLFAGNKPEQTKYRLDNPYYRLEDYQGLFAAAQSEIAVGEASTSYFQSARAAANIHKLLPDVQLVVMLRNPVDRAYSDYLMGLRTGNEPLTFEAAFEQAPKDPAEPVPTAWGRRYFRTSLYSYHLGRYFSLFEREQFSIHLAEDLSTDPSSVLQPLFQFLRVDTAFDPPEIERFNLSQAPRILPLYRLLSYKNPVVTSFVRVMPRGLGARIIGWLQGKLLGPPPSITPEMRRKLQAFFRADVLRLQEMIDRDLSAWLEEKP